MPFELTEKVDSLPRSPGVYLFEDAKGAVVYVGKAISLRNRVRQYFAGGDGRIMIPFLVSVVADVRVIVTRTEKEALLLENTLIKKHRPRFNVRLRDDSNYLHLRLDLRGSWPRYHVVRNIGSDGARYFGPYASAAKARQTLAFLQRIYPLRTCSDSVLKSRKRPCLLHQMGRCAAPCVDLIDEPAYRELATASTALLEGRTDDVAAHLRARMMDHAAREEFEVAARLRDLMQSIEATVERQDVIDPRRANRDIWGVHRDGWNIAIALVPIRDGVMGEPRYQTSEAVLADDGELLSSLLNAHYERAELIPDEILVPVLPTDTEGLVDVLRQRRGKSVSVKRPERGRKVQLLKIAASNARVRLEQANDEETRRRETLEALAEVLDLDAPPHRIECFDNSNLSGTEPVAAMAVFIDGAPDRSEYRRYKIKTARGGDDYDGMREILTRRFRRAIDDGAFPDLVVVDGGRGQLSIALEVFENLGVEQPVIGIAKPRTEHRRGERWASDKLVTPDDDEPIRLPRNSPVLRMLQHLRDQTHDHAIRYQRKVRRTSTLQSALEEIPGIGPGRRKALLKHFGSLQAIADASEQDLAAVDGIGASVARTIRAAFDS